MKNQGISLISLIITIIVIIILAAIVIFTGLGTPESANFAKFCQDCDNVYSQVLNAYADLKVAYATKNQTRTDEQIYFEVATGTDATQYNAMNAAADTSKPGSSGDVAEGDHCQRIIPISGTTGGKVKSLPDVRESNKAWYVTENGLVFNANGYPYTVDGTPYVYFTANARTTAALAGDNTEQFDRSEIIAQAIMGVSGDPDNITMADNL